MGETIDIIGDIAIVKFSKDTSWLKKRVFAFKFLKKNKSIRTVLEKASDIKGRLRKFDTKFLWGEKKLETVHKENYCDFFLHIDKTYFSPRLSNERKLVSEEISSKIKNGQKVLVMFAGVGPFSIVLAKHIKMRGKNVRVYSSEINKKASEYAKRNVSLNHLENYVTVLQGDSRNLKLEEKFDYILMPRPNLKDSFLNSVVKYSKKGTVIYYHGFGTQEKVLREIKNPHFKLLSIRKAGDIAPKKYRWLVKMRFI